MTDSSEAEFDKWWDDPQRKDFSFSRYLAALAAWSACAEKAAGVAEKWCDWLDHNNNNPCKHCEACEIAAEIRRRLGGKG